jgi:hypothetical protein
MPQIVLNPIPNSWPFCVTAIPIVIDRGISRPHSGRRRGDGLGGGRGREGLEALDVTLGVKERLELLVSVREDGEGI